MTVKKHFTTVFLKVPYYCCLVGETFMKKIKEVVY